VRNSEELMLIKHSIVRNKRNSC